MDGTGEKPETETESDSESGSGSGGDSYHDKSPIERRIELRDSVPLWLRVYAWVEGASPNPALVKGAAWVGVIVFALFVAAMLNVSLLPSGIPSYTGTAPTITNASVDRVVSGDTFVSNGTRIHLAGIVAPGGNGAVSPSRYGFKNTSATRQCLQTVGNASERNLRSIIGNRSVLVVSRNQSLASASGTVHATVFVSKSPSARSVGSQQVRQGYAVVQDGEVVENGSAYLDAQQNASRQNLGLWRCGDGNG